MSNNETITDIFIKTYHKDFIWLEYCLKSIKLFAKGFRNVVVVTDNDSNTLPQKYIDILPIKLFYVDLPKIKPTFVEHGLGYLWQQYIKLSWYKYSDADEVLVLDSDEMLTTITYPDNFKINGKYNWFYKNWDEMGDAKCWKPSTDKILKTDTKNSGMCLTGFILQKEASLQLKNHLCNMHDTTDIFDIFIKYDMPTCSEYNIFGAFIELYNIQSYNIIMRDDTQKYFNHTIKKYWSWGGLNETIIKENNDILKNGILENGILG